MKHTHKWRGRSIIGMHPKLKDRHKCTRCGWERRTFLPPHYGGNGVQYIRAGELLGGAGEKAAPPDCVPADVTNPWMPAAIVRGSVSTEGGVGDQ